MLIRVQYGFIKRAEHLWKGLSNSKSQISPIPPEGYGERFVKFITGLTVTKEEAEREGQSSDQRDGSIVINRQFTRTSTDKVINKAEHQAKKTETDGASEDPTHDRTLGAVRSPSADKTNGVSGATLPVVQEDGEAASRDVSMHNEKTGSLQPSREAPIFLVDRPPPTPPKDFVFAHKELPSIPNIPRLSMTDALRAEPEPNI